MRLELVQSNQTEASRNTLESDEAERLHAMIESFIRTRTGDEAQALSMQFNFALAFLSITFIAGKALEEEEPSFKELQHALSLVFSSVKDRVKGELEA